MGRGLRAREYNKVPAGLFHYKVFKPLPNAKMENRVDFQLVVSVCQEKNRAHNLGVV